MSHTNTAPGSGGGGGSKHTIQENSSSLTARTNLNFQDGIVATDDAGNDQTDINADYGSVSGLANTNTNGSSTSLARSDHQHKRDVRIAKAGSDVGTRNRINFIEGSNVTLTITDDAGNDEVDVTVASSAGSGAPTYTVQSKVFADSPYTAAVGEFVKYDATSGNSTVNLPAASGNSGKTIVVKKTDSSTNTVTIDGNASETIDGALTLVLSSQYDSANLVCDGSNWMII